MRLTLLTLFFAFCFLSDVYSAPDEFVSLTREQKNVFVKNKHEDKHKDHHHKEHHEFKGFPKSYEMEYIFYMPYTSTFQAAPVKYKIHAWVDGSDKKNVKTRVDSAGGMDSTISTPEWQYTVYPRLNKTVCAKRKPHKGPNTSRLLLHKERGLPHDMSNWTYMGEGVYEGKPCSVFELTETFYERKAFYELYVSKDGVPLYLSSLGQNYFTGAHFDEYIYIFTKYIPGVPDSKVFAEPESCKGKSSDGLRDEEKTRPLVLQMSAMLPAVVKGHPEYDEFMQTYRRAHASPAEYEKRLKIFLRNKKHVEQHNQRNDVSYSLELNQFADWTDEEFFAMKTGGREETPEIEKMIEENTHVFVSRENKKFPKKFSWAGTEADGVMKDQAICGSCWAFAAVQALQGQWYVASNQSLSFSEQQMVDCAWDYFNWACEGGFPALAMIYIVKNGGIMSENAYPYKGYDDFCKFYGNTTAAKFTKIGITKAKDRDSAKAALVKYGPLAVSIDAGHLDFRFYKSGVYTQPECSASKTNHAVTMLGYGKENGKEYWYIKNSWSTLWGEKGYIKVNMDHDCGITKRPVFGVADEKAVKEALKKSHKKTHHP